MKRIKGILEIGIIVLTIQIIGIVCLYSNIVTYEYTDSYQEVYDSFVEISEQYDFSTPAFLRKELLMTSQDIIDTTIEEWIQEQSIDQESKDTFIQTLRSICRQGKNINENQNRMMAMQCLWVLYITYDAFFIFFYLYSYKMLNKSGN